MTSMAVLFSLAVSLPSAGLPAYPSRHLQEYGIEPEEMEPADWNGDGQMDVLFLGHRAGLYLAAFDAFGTMRPFQLSDRQTRRPDLDLGGRLLAAGDFDGEGNRDAVAVFAGENWRPSLSYFLGLPGGGFFEVEGPVFEQLTSLAAGDMDGDGIDELLVCGRVASEAAMEIILIRPGSGVRWITMALPPLPSPPVAAILLRGPSRSIVACSAERVFFADVLEAGIGPWEEAPDLALHAGALRGGDADGDGADEVVLWGEGSMAVVRRGGAPLEVHEGTSLLDAILFPGHIAIADGSYDAILWEDLAPDLGSVLAKRIHSAGGVPRCLAAADRDGDGLTELLIGLQGELWHDEKTWGAIVFAGTAGGILDLPHNDAPIDLPLRDLVLADLDGDGDLDAVAAGRDRLSVLARGAGRWTEVQRIPSPQNLGGLRLADVDRDGRLDIIAAGLRSDYPTGDGIAVFRAAGPLSFSDPPGIYPVAENTVAVEAEDLDLDGSLDLAAVAHGCWCFPGNASSLAVLMGKGDGTFGSAALHDAGTYARNIVLHDFDGDGIDDAVLPCSEGGDGTGVSVLRGAGNGGFGEVEFVPGPANWVSLAADADGDGVRELLLARHSDDDDYLAVCSIDRAGLAAPSWALFLEDSNFTPLAIAVEDVDGDGIADILTARDYSDLDPQDRLLIHRGLGGGRFGMVERILVGNGPRAMAVGALDPGADPSVVVAGCLYEHRTSFLVALPRSAFGGPMEASFVRSDTNRDGATDLSDAVLVLAYLFAGGPMERSDAGDANDDGGLDISDPIHILRFLFLGGSPPPAPFPAAGPDPTADSLDC